MCKKSSFINEKMDKMNRCLFKKKDIQLLNGFELLFESEYFVLI